MSVSETARRSLRVTHPVLALEWSHERNDRTPEEVTAGSNRAVWWRCRLGHEWRATVYSRALKRAGCPRCARAGRVRYAGSLATTHPRVASEWHPERNGGLGPESVSAGSARAAWWRCAAGHEWRAAIGNRARKGTGCPVCFRRLPEPGRGVP